MPEISKMTDIVTLRKMKQAGESHQKRLARKMDELSTAGFVMDRRMTKNVEMVIQAVLDVKLRIGKLVATKQ